MQTRQESLRTKLCLETLRRLFGDNLLPRRFGFGLWKDGERAMTQLPIYTEAELLNCIRLDTPNMEFYCSIHSLIDLERHYNWCVYWDVDGDKLGGLPQAYRVMRKICIRIRNVGFPVYVQFSGGGFHSVIVFKPFVCQDVDEMKALYTALQEKLGSSRNGLLFDPQVRGDIARIFRLPYTLNWRYEHPRLVLPLSAGLVSDLRVDDVLKLSEALVLPPPPKVVINDATLLLKLLKIELKTKKLKLLKRKKQAKRRRHRVETHGLRPCVKRIMQKILGGDDLNHYERLIFCWCYGYHLLKKGYSREEARREIKKIFAQHHEYDEDETEYQVNYAFKNGYVDVYISCSAILSFGVCLRNECPIYRKLGRVLELEAQTKRAKRKEVESHAVVKVSTL